MRHQMKQAATTKLVAIRLGKVTEKTGLSKSHLYRLVKLGKFPKPYNLSERVVAWDESQVNEWLFEKFNIGREIIK